MDLNEFLVDEDQYENGKRFDIGPDAYVRLRSWGSSHARKTLDRLAKPYRGWTGDLPPEINTKIDAYHLAQGLITEMVGFTLDGEPFVVDMSQEADQRRVAEFLLRPAAKPFRDKLKLLALNDAAYQEAQDGQLEKNSATSPAGSSSGGRDRSKSSAPA